MAQREAKIPISKKSAELIKLKLDQIQGAQSVRITDLKMGEKTVNGVKVPTLRIIMEV